MTTQTGRPATRELRMPVCARCSRPTVWYAGGRYGMYGKKVQPSCRVHLSRIVEDLVMTPVVGVQVWYVSSAWPFPKAVSA